MDFVDAFSCLDLSQFEFSRQTTTIDDHLKAAIDSRSSYHLVYLSSYPIDYLDCDLSFALRLCICIRCVVCNKLF